MAKFYGKIGFVETVETKPDVFMEKCVEERFYSGDMTRSHKRYETNENLNDNINISNELSILADPYAYQHFASMRYIEIYGVLWKISSVEVQYPRLILKIGGVYNGQTARRAECDFA